MPPSAEGRISGAVKEPSGKNLDGLLSYVRSQNEEAFRRTVIMG
jgi:hypothetical protein